MKFSANYFTKIKIQSLAERKILDLAKLEAVSLPCFLFFCNGLVFCFSMAEKDFEKPDDVVYIDYFYYAKSEKIESIKTKDGILIDVHDFSDVPLFEYITKKIKEEYHLGKFYNVEKVVKNTTSLSHAVLKGNEK